MKVLGRGELQLSILIEMMRREDTRCRSHVPTS
jgi:predicted membrane GTPase involved in stress response